MPEGKAKKVLTPKAKSNWTRIWWVGFAIFAVAGTLIFTRVMDDLTGFDRNLHSNFKKIEPGMDLEDVLLLLGNPDGRSNEFRLGRRAGFEDEYKAAEKSSSKYYLVWRNGIDVVCSVGFDETDKVTINYCGGT